MMTVWQALALGKQTLGEVPDPKVDAALLLGDIMGETPMALRLQAQRSLTPEQEERFRSLLLLRAAREPLQYLLHTQCFFGRDFWVDARVLIPRQETETLCELALESVREIPAPHVLDLCTGSGAIAVTLKGQRPDALVVATDVSGDALAVARSNAERNGAEVRFLQGDLFVPVEDETFDCIVSNPPYIESAECDALQPEVMREPRLALDGGGDGLTFYRRIAQSAPLRLNPDGQLLVEVGDGQAAAVAALFAETEKFLDVRIHRDLFGLARFVTALRAAFPT